VEDAGLVSMMQDTRLCAPQITRFRIETRDDESAPALPFVKDTP